MAIRLKQIRPRPAWHAMQISLIFLFITNGITCRHLFRAGYERSAKKGDFTKLYPFGFARPNQDNTKNSHLLISGPMQVNTKEQLFDIDSNQAIPQESFEKDPLSLFFTPHNNEKKINHKLRQKYRNNTKFATKDDLQRGLLTDNIVYPMAKGRVINFIAYAIKMPYAIKLIMRAGKKLIILATNPFVIRYHGRLILDGLRRAATALTSISRYNPPKAFLGKSSIE